MKENNNHTITMKEQIEALLAKDDGTTLVKHTKEVINLSYNMANNLYTAEEKNTFLRNTIMAALLHDIGKCSTAFQNTINSKKKKGSKKEETFFHNTISWAFAKVNVNNANSYSCITMPVLFHHTIKNSDDITAYEIISSIKENDKEGYNRMCEFYNYMLNYVIDTYKDIDFSLFTLRDKLLLTESYLISNERLYNVSCYYEESYIKKLLNDYSYPLCVRAIVTSADRIISGNTSDNNNKILNIDIEYLQSIYNNILLNPELANIKPSYVDYEQNRLKDQMNVVDNILENKTKLNIIQASAGYGKTLIGMILFFKGKKKLIWVVPRNVIGESTYQSIIDELNKQRVNNKVKVGLFFNSQFINNNYTKDNADCNMDDLDIIVTNIDNYLGFISKNSMGKHLIDTLTYNVIFDEYHEFVCDKPVFSAFTSTLFTRHYCTDSITLLLSATPQNLDFLWGNMSIFKTHNLIKDADIKIHIKEINYETDLQNYTSYNSFTIIPTINEAQNFFINRADKSLQPILIHSQYSIEDRKYIMNNIYSEHNKLAKEDIKYKSKPVIGTSIIGVGLDISSRRINDACLSPEDTIQRLGRCARFGEYDEIEYNFMDVTDNKKFEKFISDYYNLELAKKWIKTIRQYNGKTITRGQLYELYRNFYEENKNEYINYIKNIYTESCKELSEISYKKGYNPDTKEDPDIKFTATDMTYRGENNSTFVTVKFPDGSYMEPPITIATYSLDYEKKDNNDAENKERYKYIAEHCMDIKHKSNNKHRLEYILGKAKYLTVDKAIQLSYCNKTPILLFHFTYDHIIGLRYISPKNTPVI